MSQLVVQSRKPGVKQFFTRQFDLQPTKYQNRFDVLFGVVLPVLCFEFDPLIFKGTFLGEPLAGDYQLLVYSISVVQITALVIWLTFGNRLRSFNGPMAGVLFLGGLISLLIGVLILPITLIGLLFVIGLAGFTPFLTGLVYLRNGVRGFRSHEKNQAYGSRFSVGVASAVLALALPVFVANRMSESISSSMNEVLQTSGTQFETNLDVLRRMPIIPDYQKRRLAVAFAQEKNPTKREQLRRAFLEITGEEIQPRHWFVD